MAEFRTPGVPIRTFLQSGVRVPGNEDGPTSALDHAAPPQTTPGHGETLSPEKRSAWERVKKIIYLK